MSSLFALSPHGRRRWQQNGFSLLEMLVALGVFSIMMLFLGEMMTNISGTWTLSREKLDNFSRGRALINSINRDLLTAVIRQDLPVFADAGQPGATPLSFFTRQFGPQAGGSSSIRPLTYVSYATSNYALQRTTLVYDFAGSSITWNPFAPNAALSLSTTDAQTLCTGVLAFVYKFIQTDGSFSSSFVPTLPPGGSVPNTSPTCAIQTSLVVVGNQANSIILNEGKAPTLANALLAAVPSSGSVKQAWDSYLATLPAGIYSPVVQNGIRTYERITPLGVSPAYVTP